jgi:hypothetical protein
MLPRATPRKIAADARVFLVAPPTLPEMRDRARTNTALDDPVRSGHEFRSTSTLMGGNYVDAAIEGA